MLAPVVRSEYEQVEDCGRASGSIDVEAAQVQHRFQTHRVGWLFLWASSLVVTFLCGVAVSSRTNAVPSSSGSFTEIIELDESRPKRQSLYAVYDRFFKTARYIDLTYAFSPSSAVWPGFGKASFKPAVAGADMKGYIDKGESFSYLRHGFVATSYALTTDQYGTQLDPPAHWNEYGATISDLPATFALRPLVVIDIAEKVKNDAGYAAAVEDVEEWEAAHGRVPEGSVVFFRSDWSLKWEEYEKKGLPATFPGVQLKTLKLLHLDRKILFHGHEPLDTDMTATLEGEAWLMHNNFAQAEGVTNLQDVPAFGCLLSIGFAKPLGGAGGYARYVAICPSGSTSGGTTIEESPGAPLPRQAHPLRRNEDGVLQPDPHAEDTKYCSVVSALGCNADHHEPVWATSQTIAPH